MPDSRKRPLATRAPRGIQSVEVGGRLLQALLRAGGVLSLKTLAEQAGMTAAKAHPYLVSFGKLGLIEQDEAGGHYGLGPLALQLGLVAQQRLDPVRMAGEVLPALAARLGHTVAITVWGTQGPTVVRIETPPAALHVAMRPGTVMSLTGTASGLLFAAHRTAAELRTLLRAEASKIDAAVLERRLNRVRAQGLGIAVDALVPGISAMAAPVRGPDGRLLLALTAIGPGSVFDAAVRGAVAQGLREAAAEVERRLGRSGAPG
jgi:DNA-binding IclR family transcriptional regulator